MCVSLFWQLGVVEERPPGPSVAGPTGEEATFHHSQPQLPPLPYHGNQPQGTLLNASLFLFSNS